MAVRFLPTRAEQQHTEQHGPAVPQQSERVTSEQTLAEVVELRTRLADSGALNPEPGQSDPRPELPVFEKAVKLLARRALSRQELKNELTRLGYSETESDEAVDACEERYYLNDEDLAQRLVERAERRKRLSQTMLQRMLRERLIPQSIIDNALLELGGDTEEAKMLAVARERAGKLANLDRATAERRLAGYLARRGFGGSALHRVVRRVLDEPR